MTTAPGPDFAALSDAALRAQAALDRLFLALQAPAPRRLAPELRWPLTLAAGLLLALL